MNLNNLIKSAALFAILSIFSFALNPGQLPKIETVSSKNIYILKPQIEVKGEGFSLSGNLSSRPGNGLPSNPRLHIKTYNLDRKLISSAVLKIDSATLGLNRKMPIHLDPYRIDIPSTAAKIKVEIHTN